MSRLLLLLLLLSFLPAPPAAAQQPFDLPGLSADAQRYFRDPKKFWKICDASDVLDPFDVIVPGRPILIPPNK